MKVTKRKVKGLRSFINGIWWNKSVTSLFSPVTIKRIIKFCESLFCRLNGKKYARNYKRNLENYPQ